MSEREQPRADERELIRRAKEYDGSAFAEIYERYYQSIYNYVYYRVDDDVLAEDLTSEVFLKTLESIHSFTFRPGATFSSWLYRIASNLVIDHFRLLPRQPTVLLEDSIVSDVEEPAEALDRQLTAEQLRQAVRHLSEDQQQVVVLKFVDGLKLREIAHVLGKSEGAVKSLQHRAVISLGRILGAPEQ